MDKKRLGIYIHWPYCLSKCPYCDFFSQVKKDIPQEKIVDEYLSDMEFYCKLSDEYFVDSIFFGGGTPSLINPIYIEKIIDKISSLWQVTKNVEISLEANPNSNHKNLFADLKKAGINRLSLGVQALDEKDLKFLGRSHSLQEAHKSIDEVLQTFDNHSIDLIYARPNQKIDDWDKELKKATALGVGHLSLYQLTIEEGTAFAKMGLKAMNDDLAEKMYLQTANVLADNGYLQYEVSNYAKSGFECRHNMGYWQGDDYVGVGKGAIGYIRSNKQIFMTSYPRVLEEVSALERARELIIMGLRLVKGIEKNKFKQVCGFDLCEFVNKNKLQYLKDNELLIEDNVGLRATTKGQILLNYIIEQLIFD